MKFYTASSFKNIESVRYVNEELKRIGYIHTYDWTQNDRASSQGDLERIGREEKRAVIASDFIIVILPAGKGSHIEMGIAIGLEKKIMLYSPNEEVNDRALTSTFYHLPEVEKCFGSLDDLISKIIELEGE
ncbi:group-specific protein [Rossellomorea vietnamensis]|uniref:Group-specific protein n=1 Tax=Rossellomorea vietnamensis TaxID=218284 RepID=A0A5D4MGR8_9BACI|nr:MULTISPECIES: group-specific protein [Bacillaceae]TYS00256.1 group-specific protein [Rossellomorea vietnamensis]